MMMDFGKLKNVDGINWSLPEDDPKNALRFGAGGDVQVYLGSSGWAVKHWKGKIYPKDSAPEDFLRYYSRSFSCIELGTTFYRIPPTAIVQAWQAEVLSEFIFCPKIFQGISHSPLGLTDKSLLRQWLAFLEDLGENSGPSFIQFHNDFSYSDKRLLFRFLENWPREFQLSLEFRNPSWFDKNKILPALTDYLHRKNMGLVITDVAGRRDVLHTSVTSDWVVIRLVGNDLHPSDELRLQDWGQKLSDWRQSGPKRIYLLLHQPEDNWTIEFARLARDLLQMKGFPGLPSFNPIVARDLFNL